MKRKKNKYNKGSVAHTDSKLPYSIQDEDLMLSLVWYYGKRIQSFLYLRDALDPLSLVTVIFCRLLSVINSLTTDSHG